MNAIQLVDFDEIDDAVQLLICEECGITGCEPGSWGSIRKIGERIAFTPAFSAIREGWQDCSPPTYMLTKGLPAFSMSAYTKLFEQTGRVLPALKSIRTLSQSDKLLLLQMSAPGFVLGKFGKAVRLEQELIIAVTEGDLSIEVETLENLISLAQTCDQDVFAERPDRLIEFHLDLPDFPAWRPFGYSSRGAVLNLSAIYD